MLKLPACLSAYEPILRRYERTLPKREAAGLVSWLSAFPYKFQLEWLLEPNRYAICNKARQIGISHSTAAASVLWGAFHGETTTIVSEDEKKAVEVLDKARKHARVLRALGSQMAGQSGRNNTTELSFASGGRVLAMSSTGGRSFTGNALLDEFGYHTDPYAVWDAVAATTQLGFRLRVISTPNGVGNLFELLWRRIRTGELEGWAAHEIPIQRAMDDGYPVDMRTCWISAKGDPRLFDQLYNCSFLDNELQYIPTDLIDGCSTDALDTTDGPYYAGLDIGKTVDRTVLYVLRKVSGPAYVTAYVEVHKRTDPDGLNEMVARAFKRFNLRRLCLDETGIGAFPAMTMQKAFGESKVEPITFTLPVKEELATGLYTAFAKKQLKIPKTKLADAPVGEPERIRSDIASLRRIITTAGNVRYDAPHTDEGHADRAWALALALHAAMNAPSYARM